MLTGEFKNVLDEKGRLILPTRIRNELPGNMVVITQGVDRCLWIFTPSQWDSLARKLMESTSPFQSRSRMVQRRIIAPAQEIEIDKAGRIAIPQSLREFARLTKECVILGIDKYIEVWDADEYASYWQENEAEFRGAAEELSSLIL
ncbi:MAG TPA: division/cell wall cluster transcriptional repressor MraZ [Termitinemataceae bacterium]|uniref:division/cell wall cluster transcriptional repressor MraZ n=1 Tax=Treponema sp. J25 TaxID=2094121 RepID=UPI00104B0745|nr:division/cell wall cluster transcriptional repressor MraZ [Treponema sp. J25]MCX7656984.1 division/cell wall cluster transcriptional repressor MraZ [Treponemataceae bacterium]HOJ98286.1 division/cell wall cluster transcriptional repressor MraZ [Termitinemataceae bacterium]TCW62602.1 cell division/cell wall cluster transcriptional repressor MraZ [Treponema sp. J25]HOM22650.1 division/cell wall cluster transcriptional repressor MraZ [Termitinemataceae bacterium]HPP99489.1 division/cell wall c